MAYTHNRGYSAKDKYVNRRNIRAADHREHAPVLACPSCLYSPKDQEDFKAHWKAKHASGPKPATWKYGCYEYGRKP